jgi:hypothetical protein
MDFFHICAEKFPYFSKAEKKGFLFCKESLKNQLFIRALQRQRSAEQARHDAEHRHLRQPLDHGHGGIRKEIILRVLHKDVIEQRQAEQFLSELQARGKATWLRHVYIPGLNDNDDSIRRLCELRKTFPCVQHIELLPFRRLCLEKYQSMGIDFPLANTPEPTPAEIDAIKAKFPQLN